MRRGMALPLALVALVVIGMLVSAVFAGAHLEQRIGGNTMYAVQAAGAAEVGAAAVLAEWNDRGLSLLAPGESATSPSVPLPGRAAYAPTVTRLNGELFLVRVEGTKDDAGGGLLARREVDLVVRVADSGLSGGAAVWPLAGRAWR